MYKIFEICTSPRTVLPKIELVSPSELCRTKSKYNISSPSRTTSMIAWSRASSCSSRLGSRLEISNSPKERKGGSVLEGLNLIILDDVHLLNDEWRWVLKIIVAWLFRTLERTQRRVRLVGLSATLPNYLDVADFLRVPRESGLFHFDASFRPVPLVIHFVGVKNPKDCNNNMSRKRNMRDIYNEKCYEMVLSNLRCDKQMLVFVHSRRETVKYCEYVIERALWRTCVQTGQRPAKKIPEHQGHYSQEGYEPLRRLPSRRYGEVWPRCSRKDVQKRRSEDAGGNCYSCLGCELACLRNHHQRNRYLRPKPDRQSRHQHFGCPADVRSSWSTTVWYKWRGYSDDRSRKGQLLHRRSDEQLSYWLPFPQVHQVIPQRWNCLWYCDFLGWGLRLAQVHFFGCQVETMPWDLQMCKRKQLGADVA